MSFFFSVPGIVNALELFSLVSGETYAAKVDNRLLFIRLKADADDSVLKPNYQVRQSVEYRVYSESEGLSEILEKSYVHHGKFSRRRVHLYRGFHFYTSEFTASLSWDFYADGLNEINRFSIFGNTAVSYFGQIALALEEIEASGLAGRIAPEIKSYDRLNRLWMNKAGVFVEGKYVRQNDSTVLLRSFNGKQWEIAKDDLSEMDRVFLKLLVAHPDYDPRRREHAIYLDGFFAHSNRVETEAPVGGVERVVVDDSVNRGLIPSFNQSDYRSGDTSCGPASLLNFVVWWGEHRYPEIMPKGTREQQIKMIQRRLITQCESRAGGTRGADLIEGLTDYIERYTDGFAVESMHVIAPSANWIIEHTRGWNAVVVAHGYYKESGGRLRRATGHYTSMVEFGDDAAVLNTWGRQFPVLLKAISIREITGSRLEGYLSAHSESDQLIEYLSAAQQGLVPAGNRAIIEEAFVFKLHRLESSNAVQ